MKSLKFEATIHDDGHIEYLVYHEGLNPYEIIGILHLALAERVKFHINLTNTPIGPISVDQKKKDQGN